MISNLNIENIRVQVSNKIRNYSNELIQEVKNVKLRYLMIQILCISKPIQDIELQLLIKEQDIQIMTLS